MAALTNEIKAFIVQGLATYLTPTQVAEAVAEEFDVTVTRQTVAKHDPTKVAGKDLGKEWIELFHLYRKEFQEDIQAIPIANKAYRLRVLDRMARDAERSKNRPLTATLLEQAAKEVGEVFTNKQKVDNVSSDGSMSPPQELTVEVAKAISKKLDDDY